MLASFWRARTRRLSTISLRRRAGWLMLAFAIVPAVLLGTVVSFVNYRMDEKTLAGALTSTVNATARDVDNYLTTHQHALGVMARAPRLGIAFDGASMQARLVQLHQEYPGFLTLLAADADGAIIAAEPATNPEGVKDFWRGLSVADRGYFQAPKTGGQPYVSDLFRGRGFGSDYIVAVSVPVIVDGKFLGVIEGSLDPAGFLQSHHAVTAARGYELLITDIDGDVVFASPDLKIPVGARSQSYPWLERLAAVPAGATHDVRTETSQLGVLRAMSGVHGAGWRILVLAPTRPLNDSILVAVLSGLLMVALAWAVALLVLPAATRSLTSHIKRLGAQIEAFSPESDSAQPPLTELPRELQPIHDSFAVLGSRLRIAFDELHRGVSREMALRLQVEERQHELRASERLLRLVIENVPEGVAMIDQDGRFVLWNGAAASLIAGEPGTSDLTSDTPRAQLLFPDRTTPHPGAAQLLSGAMRGEAINRYELVARDGERGDAHLQVDARRIRDADGRTRGAVAVFHDVTREKTTQEQLLVSDRMASIGMLAAGVGHEINNPLGAIIANVEQALREIAESGGAAPTATTQPLREILDDVHSAATRIRTIARDLRTLARSDASETGALDVHPALEASLRMAASEARSRARLVKEFRATGYVEGTESRLGQVFLNLIVNAAQAIPEGRAEANTIRVATRDDGAERIVVEIADSGSGIPPEALRRLFTPFFTTKAAGVGTGLGLTICQRIVTGFGGEIQVESELGKGTTFRVVLRRAQAPTAIAEPATVVAAAPNPATRRGRVLVVDDEPLMLSAIRRVLMSEHEVVATTDAKEALRRIEGGERFDVILCDLMMPQMTGMDLHAALCTHAVAQADCIVFLSGGAFTTQAREFIERVPNQKLDKPFEREELRRLIAERLAKAEAA